MKKTIIFFFILVSLATSSWGQRTKQNKQIGIGMDINIAYISELDHLTRMAYGINVNLLGLHFDYSVAPALHRRSPSLNTWKNESRILFVNIGYNINIGKRLIITPIVGYARAETGSTDGWDWTVDNKGIVNEFITEKRVDLFNFGARVGYQVYNNDIFNVVVSATAQRYAFGLNIGMNFKL